MKYTFSAPGTTVPDVTVLRGDGPALIVGGYAKWDVVDRPHRMGFVQYQGSEPVRMDVPILFDGWKTDQDQEVFINNLLRMRQETATGLPPTVKIAGGVPRRNVAWVIDDITWGTNVIYKANAAGTLVRFRQDAIVHLLMNVDVELLGITSKNPGNTRGTTAKGAKHSIHVVKKGETLPSIAVAEYGDRNKWKDIASANNIRDPRTLKVGQKLKLP